MKNALVLHAPILSRVPSPPPHLPNPPPKTSHGPRMRRNSPLTQTLLRTRQNLRRTLRSLANGFWFGKRCLVWQTVFGVDMDVDVGDYRRCWCGCGHWSWSWSWLFGGWVGCWFLCLFRLFGVSMFCWVFGRLRNETPFAKQNTVCETKHRVCSVRPMYYGTVCTATYGLIFFGT